MDAITKVVHDNVKEFTCHEVTDSSRLREDLDLDSFDYVEFIMAMEEEFDLEITDEDAEKIKTVGEAVIYINTALGN